MSMKPAIPIFDEQETFYAPFFQVKLQGQSLQKNVIFDVMSVTYRDNINEIDSFEFVINNWDAETQHHKYEGKLAQGSKLKGMFDPGKRIELWMGYRGTTDNTRKMLDGEITTLEPSFSESGVTTLSVRGQNVLYKLKKKQHSCSWGTTRLPKRDSEIAELIGRQPESKTQPGLGMHVRIDPKACGQEAPQSFVFMNNQYDIVFLLERARLHGYSVFLELDAKGHEQLYFGPSENLRDVTYKLEWGKSLMQIRPTLTTTKQVSQVTVHAWDRRTASAITVSAQWGDKGLEINNDQQAVALAVQGREEVIADHPFHTKQEALEFAQRRLKSLKKEMVKISATSIGLPDLRAGRQVEIDGLGDRYSGKYFITETTHTINESGYRTTFNARREQPL